MPTTTNLTDVVFDALQPALAVDLVTEFVEDQAISWAPGRPAPVLLDPIETVVYRLLDGSTSIGELLVDVHEALGVPMTIARGRFRRVLQRLDGGGLLATSVGGSLDADEDSLFPGPPNP